MSLTRLATLLTAALVLCLSSGCTTTVGSILKKYHYTELLPPSTLVGCGTIVAVTQKDPFVAEIVCTQRANIGNQAVESSPTETAKLTSDLSKKFNADAKLLNKVKTSAELSSISKITLDLSDVQVFEISDDEVFAARQNRSDNCNAAIRHREARRQVPTLIKSVIIADVTYSVETANNQKLSAQALNELLKNLGADLKYEGSSKNGVLVKGSNLVWGVRDNKDLVHLETKAIGKAVGNNPVLPSGGFAEIRKTVDSAD